MKQIIQSLRTGDTFLEDVPAPMVKEGHVLVQTTCSLISPGTERMLLEFGKSNWLNKARSQPERLRQVIEKIKTNGLKPTLNAVLAKLNKPVPLGYSNVGVVIATGKGVTNLKTGDRVVSNGHHAEVVCVPQNLAARIPPDINDEEAVFTVTGAIALQGIRLAEPTFGETIVVIGLGLIGQLTAQLLKANGCKVIGIDTDAERCRLAEDTGIGVVCSKPGSDPVTYVWQNTHQTGADAVIIATATQDNQVMAQAAQMSRKRGRIILTGVAGLRINRPDFYEKELSFHVSCSYGPGRYDFNYEVKGQDYPVGFVRWTEQRNFEAILQALSLKQLNVAKLITGTLPLKDYKKVYDTLGKSRAIATIFTYPRNILLENTIYLSSKKAAPAAFSVGIIGAGNFTASVVLPALVKNNANIKAIASANGLSASLLAKKYAIPAATTDINTIFDDPGINTVIITTTHNTHAALTIAALKAGKHVFVEKPLAITNAEIDDIIDTYESSGQTLSVGYNRRFAPLSSVIKELTIGVAPMNITITVNAGFLPAGNWLSDTTISGGRIIGEACHFIDLCSFITNSQVKAVCMNALDNDDCNASLLLQYQNGSNATIHYYTNGHSSYDKERIEIYQANKVVILENWRQIKGYGFSVAVDKSMKQDKGHTAQFHLFKKCIEKGGKPLISFNSIINTSRTTIAALESYRTRSWVDIKM